MTIAALALPGMTGAQEAIRSTSVTASSAHTTTFGNDGTAHIDNLSVPFSDLASDEARREWSAAHADGKAPRSREGDPLALRAAYDKRLAGVAARMRTIYPVTIEAKTIAGVKVEVVRPKDGVAPGNAHRVLINFHGGGFMWGEGSGGEVESIPVASLGRIEVVTVAYRQGPEHRYPAATEDGVAVYKALLAQHRPGEIGIYGCSAGGVLTAQTTAWLITHNVPTPGAIGTFCSSAAPLAGDSMYVNQALNNEKFGTTRRLGEPYMADVDWKDPMVFATNSPAILGKFPPTLLIAGSRDFAVSSLFYTQRRLTALGVDAELHVWDGLPHAFFANPDLPESREVYDVIVKFFDRRLAR